MIKFLKKQMCYKKQIKKQVCANCDNDYFEHCMRDLSNLDKTVISINNRLENEHKSISLLHRYNEENKQEIHELKRKNKMLVHTLRIFAIYFIMRS